MINLDIDLKVSELKDETPKWIDSNYLYPSAFQGVIRRIYPFLLSEFNLREEEIWNLDINRLDMFIGWYKKDIALSGIEYDRAIAIYDSKIKKIKSFEEDIKRLRNF